MGAGIASLKYQRQSWGHLVWAQHTRTAEKARRFYAGTGMRADGYLGDGQFMAKCGEITEALMMGERKLAMASRSLCFASPHV